MKHTLWYSEGNRLDYKPVQAEAADGRVDAAQGPHVLKHSTKITMTKRTFQIYRYDPDKDAKPYMQTLEVELDGHERMLLDALMKLKAVDPTLSLPPLLPRRRLRLGRDEHQRQERPGLPDQHAHAARAPIVLKPLPGLPVIRDLIVDMTQFFKQYNSIKPYLRQRQRCRPRRSACSRPKSATS